MMGEVVYYYYRARYYDPATGRFLSEDPAGFGGDGADFYTYVKNGPTNAIDPFGLTHQPGGPTHHEGIRCRPGEPCPVLLDKLEKWAHMLASHYLWDWRNWNRHTQPGPKGGPPDIPQIENGFNNCLQVYLEECEGDCKKQTPKSKYRPVPIPIIGPVLDAITDPIIDVLQGALNDIKNYNPQPTKPIAGPGPVPVWWWAFE